MTAVVDRPRRIGEVAVEVGVTARTIRYYEQLGLLGEADGRMKGTHRLYDQADVDRLRELIRLRDLLGLSLEELTELAEAAQVAQYLREKWHNSTGNQERVDIVRRSTSNVERQLDLVRTRQRSLAEFEGQLVDKITHLHAKLAELEPT
jgi:DNA-binding transcriptional MerR regulator